MKRWISILMVALMLCWNTAVAEEAPAAFSMRDGVTFGMTMEQVQEIENANGATSSMAVKDVAQMLMVEGAEFNSHEAELGYVFVDDALYFGGYDFTDSNAGDDVFEDQLKALKAQYGEPVVGGEEEMFALMQILAPGVYETVNDFSNGHYWQLEDGTTVFLIKYSEKDNFVVAFVDYDGIMSALEPAAAEE